MPQLSRERLVEIIAEEVRRLTESSDVDHMAMKDVVGKAADLITAITEFEEDASPAMLNALTPHIMGIKKALQNMVSTPASYVTVAKREPRTVQLRATPVEK